MKKFYFIFIIFLFGCGYTPIYKVNSSPEFKIVILDMQGNTEMNRLIKNELKTFQNKKTKKEFLLYINSQVEKTIITKDTSGSTSNYQIYAKSSFGIKLNGKVENVTFEEKFNIKKMSNTFEQKNYENIIKTNFAKSIREKLILKLLSI